jgi:hypothetical protein
MQEHFKQEKKWNKNCPFHFSCENDARSATKINSQSERIKLAKKNPNDPFDDVENANPQNTDS